jgi:predicted protein tyrosine phosphatase
MRSFIKLYSEFGSSKHSGISRRLLIDLQDLNDKAEGLNLDDLQLVAVNKKLEWKIIFSDEQVHRNPLSKMQTKALGGFEMALSVRAKRSISN